MMNNRGTIILRDVMFMVVLFGAVMALMSIFVLDVSSEYGNTNLTSEYNDLGVSTLGNVVSGDINKTITSQREATSADGEGEEGTLQAIGKIEEAIKGASRVLLGVFIAPVIAGNAIEVLMNSLEVPQTLAKIISDMIIGLLYIIIIFGIISALLKGGKM